MLSRATYLLQIRKAVDLDSDRRIVEMGYIGKSGQTNVVTMRVGRSLVQAGVATLFWQCLLAPNGCIKEPVYVVVDQLEPFLVFWHYSLERLLRVVSSKNY